MHLAKDIPLTSRHLFQLAFWVTSWMKNIKLLHLNSNSLINWQWTYRAFANWICTVITTIRTIDVAGAASMKFLNMNGTNKIINAKLDYLSSKGFWQSCFIAYHFDMKIRTWQTRVFSSKTDRNTSWIGRITWHNTFESFFDATFMTNSIQFIIAINVHSKIVFRSPYNH